MTVFVNVHRLQVSDAKFSFSYIQIIAEINFLFLPLPPPVKGYVAKQLSLYSFHSLHLHATVTSCSNCLHLSLSLHLS